MSGRNPIVIPTQDAPRRRGCPVCGEADYSGRMAFGVATFTCRKCGNEWQGGIGVEPQDPRVPVPPTSPKDQPIVEFGQSRATGERPVPYMTRRPDPTPDFRKGSPIPNGENDG